jgi:hypothetical protein
MVRKHAAAPVGLRGLGVRVLRGRTPPRQQVRHRNGVAAANSQALSRDLSDLETSEERLVLKSIVERLGLIPAPLGRALAVISRTP